MVADEDLLERDFEAYVKSHQNKTLLRFLTCGSVDDGKSTLIGRLLFESKLIFDDQLAQLEADSKRVGTQGDKIDFALLVDGLAAEREQGITIDVAYRFFVTDKRKFIVADTPGHEQYTRNMVTGASTADLAIILIDARKGVLSQTKRHSYLVSLLGIRHAVLAVNKMDLVDYSEVTFAQIDSDYRRFAAEIGLKNVVSIPISGLNGDNITERSAATAWYAGPTLMEHLESVELDSSDQPQPFRFPVQWVNRPDSSFRGYSGLIAGGTVRRGEKLRVLPAGRESHVERIVTADGDLESATLGQSVTITLEDEIDISRGDMLVAADSPAAIADQFEATIVWMDETGMIPGRPYLLKLGTATVSATNIAPKYKINVNTLEHLATRKLDLNEIGICNLTLDRPVAFDPYSENRDTGGFILIDRLTNNTVGAGMLHFALRRSQNIHWQAMEVDRKARAEIKGQKGCILWLTGLSGSGKSTIGNMVEKRLFGLGRHTYMLDGDNVRHGLNKDLGFTDVDRVENIRRVAEVARLMVDAGLIVIVTFISPFATDRQTARDLVAAGEFFEIYVSTPLEVAEGRDRKGLYAKARRGEIANFTGINSPYEPPVSPEITLDTTALDPAQAAEKIIEALANAGVIPHA
jgi:bifunctional enzyme CysN/CysC